jgi:hypothetical protein
VLGGEPQLVAPTGRGGGAHRNSHGQRSQNPDAVMLEHPSEIVLDLRGLRPCGLLRGL